MANLLSILRRRTDEIARLSQQDYLAQLAAAPWYPGQSTLYSVGRRPVESVPNSYLGYAEAAYASCTVVGACMRVRRDIFSQARFTWRELTDDGVGVLSHDDGLDLLERPWPNGTTGQLLTKMITDVDLCGNSYIVNEGDRLRWRRPDWMFVVLSGDPNVDASVDVLGYVYTPGGVGLASGVPYTVAEVAHWAPIPRPGSEYIGMSWMTSALREIQADKHATDHKLNFFVNGASLGPVFRLPANMSPEQFKKFRQANEEAHVGVENAYKPLYIGGGAEVTLSAATFQQLELKATVGSGETRIAANAGIHPTIVGLSEGLAGSSLNAGNFTAARRLVADITLHKLWQDACATLASFVEVPDGKELWIRESAIPFLREDAKDAAEIFSVDAQSATTLVREGYKPETVTPAVAQRNILMLEHSGALSVQLQDPGTEADGVSSGDGGPKALTPSGATMRRSWLRLTPTGIERAEFDPSLHPRGAQGRFRTTLDRIVDGLRRWAQAGGKGDPFEGFTREQLRRTAVARGVKLRRGASEKEIRDGLLDNLRDALAGDEGPSPVKKAAKKTAEKTAAEAGVDSFDGRSRSAWMADARQAGLAVPRGAPAHEVARLVGEHQARRVARDSYALRYGGRERVPGDPSREEYIDSVMAQQRARHNAKLAAEGLPPHSGDDTPAKKAAKKAVPKAPTGIDLASLRKLDDPEAIRDALDLHKLPELKEALREQKLPLSGRKRELVDRLVEHLHGGDKPVAKKAAKKATSYALAPGYRGPTARARHNQREDALLAVANGGSAGLGPAMGTRAEALDNLESAGYVRWDGQRWHLTDKGREYVDALGATKGTFPHGGEQMTLAQSTARQAEIDSKKGPAEVIADVHELLVDQASERALKARISTGAKMHGLPDTERDKLLAAVDESRQVEVENRIRAAFSAIKARPVTPDSNVDLRQSGWVRLADLRNELGESINRHELDDALKRLASQQDAVLIPESAQWLLRPEDRDAELTVGGQRKHWLQIDDSSPRPTPLRTALDDLAKRSGITVDGKPGDRTLLNGQIHQLRGEADNGDPVVVVTPGYVATLSNGETVRMVKAKVEPARLHDATPSDRVAQQPSNALVAARPKREPTKAEQSALSRYGGDGGYVINNDLRATEGRVDQLQPRNRASVEALDALMGDSPLPTGVVVHRKLSLARNPFSTSTTGEVDPLDRDLVGFTWTEPAYSSTSVGTEQLRDREISLRITVPAGTPALSHPEFDNDEIVLPHGLTFRVTADHGKDDRFVRHLDVEVVPAPAGLTGQPSGPRTVASFEEGKAFLAEHYDQWRQGLSDREQKALAFYQSPAFPLVNGLLRGVPEDQIQADVPVTPALLDRARRTARDLQAAIDKAPPLTAPLVVHRSFAADQFGPLSAGMEIVDEGFVSTSLTKVDGGGGVGQRGRPAIATITLPEGTRAAAGSARELVLPPGSRFRVTSVRQRGGTTHVEMELIPPDRASKVSGNVRSGGRSPATPVVARDLFDAHDEAREVRRLGGAAPYPGQRYRHGWIPIGIAEVLDSIDIDMVDAERLEPYHEVTDDKKLGDLVASMRDGGWKGPPVVVLPGRDHGWGPTDPVALTGAHRIRAARTAGVDVPVLDLNDLLAKYNVSLDQLDEMYGVQPDDERHIDSVRNLDQHLPADVISYLGLDVH